jgi:hypothetical protein
MCTFLRRLTRGISPKIPLGEVLPSPATAAANARQPRHRRSHRGRYHTDRQPGEASQRRSPWPVGASSMPATGSGQDRSLSVLS